MFFHTKGDGRKVGQSDHNQKHIKISHTEWSRNSVKGTSFFVKTIKGQARSMVERIFMNTMGAIKISFTSLRNSVKAIVSPDDHD